MPSDVFDGAPQGAHSIGLRPEHIVLGEGKEYQECQVIRTEFLGDLVRIHLKLKDHDLITTTSTETSIRSGDTVSIRPENPHYFDANGARIYAGEQ